MPNLPTGAIFVQPICSVSPRDLCLEFVHIPHGPKVHALFRREDCRLFGKVTVVGVVQGILYEVANQHFDLGRRCGEVIQLICRDFFVIEVFAVGVVLKGNRRVIVDLVRNLPRRGFTLVRSGGYKGPLNETGLETSLC